MTSVMLHLILCLSVVYRMIWSLRGAWMKLEELGKKLEEERIEDGEVWKKEKELVETKSSPLERWIQTARAVRVQRGGSFQHEDRSSGGPDRSSGEGPSSRKSCHR